MEVYCKWVKRYWPNIILSRTLSRRREVPLHMPFTVREVGEKEVSLHLTISLSLPLFSHRRNHRTRRRKHVARRVSAVAAPVQLQTPTARFLSAGSCAIVGSALPRTFHLSSYSIFLHNPISILSECVVVVVLPCLRPLLAPAIDVRPSHDARHSLQFSSHRYGLR